MSLVTRERHGKDYYYFRKGAKKYLYLGPVDSLDGIKQERVLEALEYCKSLDSSNIELEYGLMKLLSPERKDAYLSNRLKDLDEHQIDLFLNLMSEDGRKEYLQSRIADLQTRLRLQARGETPILKAKVAVYGLSREGYAIATQMTLRGANAVIIDEAMRMGFHLKPDIVETHPNVTSLKESEPLLWLETEDTAIKNADYLFFTPRLRKYERVLKKEISKHFTRVIKQLKKGTSVIYCLPTGIGGNDENIAVLQEMTGYLVGKDVSYYYCPIEPTPLIPQLIGFQNGRVDATLDKLLRKDQQKRIEFSDLRTSEIVYGLNVFYFFPGLLHILRQPHFSKLLRKRVEDLDIPAYEEIYLDDITKHLFELKMLSTSDIDKKFHIKEMAKLGFRSEYCNVETFTSLAYQCVKYAEDYLEQYFDDIVDRIRDSLKRRNLGVRNTQIGLVWTLDFNEMRGDRLETKTILAARLADYWDKDVLPYQKLALDWLQTDKPTIMVGCSKADFEDIRAMEANVKKVKLKPTAPLISIK